MSTSTTTLDSVQGEFSHYYTEHKFHRIFRQESFKNQNMFLFEKLTRREREILRYLTEGFNNPQIAERLFISRSTVEQHRKNINRKLRIKNFAQLFQYALAFDIV